MSTESPHFILDRRDPLIHRSLQPGEALVRWDERSNQCPVAITGQMLDALDDAYGRFVTWSVDNDHDVVPAHLKEEYAVQENNARVDRMFLPDKLAGFMAAPLFALSSRAEIEKQVGRSVHLFDDLSRAVETISAESDRSAHIENAMRWASFAETTRESLLSFPDARGSLIREDDAAIMWDALTGVASPRPWMEKVMTMDMTFRVDGGDLIVPDHPGHWPSEEFSDHIEKIASSHLRDQYGELLKEAEVAGRALAYTAKPLRDAWRGTLLSAPEVEEKREVGLSR